MHRPAKTKPSHIGRHRRELVTSGLNPVEVVQVCRFRTGQFVESGPPSSQNFANVGSELTTSKRNRPKLDRFQANRGAVDGSRAPCSTGSSLCRRSFQFFGTVVPHFALEHLGVRQGHVPTLILVPRRRSRWQKDALCTQLQLERASRFSDTTIRGIRRAQGEASAASKHPQSHSRGSINTLPSCFTVGGS